MALDYWIEATYGAVEACKLHCDPYQAVVNGAHEQINDYAEARNFNPALSSNVRISTHGTCSGPESAVIAGHLCKMACTSVFVELPEDKSATP